MRDKWARGPVPWLAAIGLGMLLGLASVVGDAAALRVLNGLANAAAPWLIVAFACGTLQRDVRAGAGAGMLALLVAVAAYYLGIRVVFGPDRSYAGPLIALWLGAAVVGGGTFGLAGSVASSGNRPWRAVAAALPAAALIAEAAHRLLQIASSGAFDWTGTYGQVLIAESVGGFAALWFAARGPDARTVVGAAAGLSAAGLAALVAVEQLARVLAVA